MKKECPKCRGLGKFPLSKERILITPRYTHIKCPVCNGTGKIKEEFKENQND